MGVTPPNVHSEDFERFADECDRTADDIRQAIRALDHDTRPSSGWSGPSAESFRQLMEHQLETARSAERSLRDAASSFRHDAGKARDLWRQYYIDLAEEKAREAAAKVEAAAKAAANRTKKLASKVHW